jgi:hypothetical protein
LDRAFSKYDERKTNEMHFSKYTQFRQDHFGLPEDGAPEAPKHAGAS